MKLVSRNPFIKLVGVATLLASLWTSEVAAGGDQNACARMASIVDITGAPPGVIDRSLATDIDVLPERLLSGKSGFGADRDFIRHAAELIVVGPLLGTSDMDGAPKVELVCLDSKITLTVTMTHLNVRAAMNTFAIRPAVKVQLYTAKSEIAFEGIWIMRDEDGALLNHLASPPGPDYAYPIRIRKVIGFQ